MTLPMTIRCIRDPRIAIRLTEFGRFEAANSPNPNRRRILLAIAAAQGSTGWAEEADVRAGAYPGIKDLHAVRFRLRKLAAQGLVELQEYPTPRVTDVALLTSRGADILSRSCQRQGIPPVTPIRQPRPDQLAHHLLVVQAALLVLQTTRGTLVRFWGDEDLRSEARQGRKMRRGDDEKLPDGRLLFRLPNGFQQVAEFEILTSKYTDATILKKYDELAEGTIFASPTRRLVDRMESLTGYRPLLLTP